MQMAYFDTFQRRFCNLTLQRSQCKALNKHQTKLTLLVEIDAVMEDVTLLDGALVGVKEELAVVVDEGDLLGVNEGVTVTDAVEEGVVGVGEELGVAVGV